MKTVVNLTRRGSIFTVTSTTNTIDPLPGEHLQEKDVQDLLAKAKVSQGTLTVNVKV
jgi:hypothetical protein